MVTPSKVTLSKSTIALIIIFRDKFRMPYDQIVRRLDVDFDIHTNVGICASYYARYKGVNKD